MEPLLEALRDRTALLFVGSGVSCNLGLPSWEALVGHMGKDLGYDSDVFLSLGDLPQLAEYYKAKTGSFSGLRSWMDRSWHDSSIRIEKSRIHELLVGLRSRLIYTTNYDRWIERAHEHYGIPYTRVASALDFTKCTSDTPQIVKFHGDFDGDDDDLVISESDYFRRLSFDSALDLKLRADLIGRVALFLGYSLSDINIRYMLYKLHRMWDSLSVAGRPKSYVFLGRPNSVAQELLAARGMTAIFSEQDDAGVALETFLRDLTERISG